MNAENNYIHCTNVLRFEHKFTRTIFSQKDLVLMLDYSRLAKKTLGDNHMSVILQMVDQFDTMKNP